MKKATLCCILLQCLFFLSRAQEYKIRSCSQPLTIVRSGKKIQKPVAELVGYTILTTDAVQTGNYEAELVFAGSAGTVRLPAGKTITVSDLVSSSYYRLPGDSYWAVVGKIWKYFKTNDETTDEFYNRSLEERGGVAITKGNFKTDLLENMAVFKTVMTQEDSLAVVAMNDSLAHANVKDSVIYYLEDAVYYDSHNYLRKAYNGYRNAYRYLQARRRHSQVVTTAYRQFVYRVGHFAEGDKIK